MRPESNPPAEERISRPWLSLPLGAACLVLAGVSGVAAFAASTRGPQIAIAVPTGWVSGDQQAVLAQAIFASRPKDPPVRQILPIGRAGLRQSPLSAASLSMVGLSYDSLGKEKAAGAAMRASLRLTRRNMLTHFWFAEQFARQQRFASALSHFDLALRTDYNAPTVMLPLLGQAISDPAVADGLANLMRKRPAWLLSAVDTLSAVSPHPASLAGTIMKAGGLPEGEAFRRVENRLIERLVESGDVDTARTYFLSLRDSSPARLADPAFSKATVSAFRGPLAWRGTESAVASGAFVSRSTGLELEGSSAPRDGGAIAERILFLQPGRYRVTAKVRLDGNDDASLYGTLACMDDGQQGSPARFDLTRGIADVRVPEGCRSQRLTLGVEPGTGPLGAQVVVSQFAMEGASGSAGQAPEDSAER